jgi:hypothetical protein
MTAPIRQKEFTRFADSIGYIFSLDMKQKEAIADEIFKKQPQLLFEVLGLNHFGVPMDRIEYVLNLLFIFYDYYYDRGKIELPKVTEKMIDDAHENIIAMLKFMDKEGGPETSAPLMKKATLAYPEIEALAFLTGYMNENGFTVKTIENEHCLRTARVILDCFMKVKKQKEEKSTA